MTAKASRTNERAVALAPGNAKVFRESGPFAVSMGRAEAGIAATCRALALDPLDPRNHSFLGAALMYARRYDEAAVAVKELISLNPAFEPAYGLLGLNEYLLGDLQGARASCETKPDHPLGQICLAVTYDKLGRHNDAENMLTKLRASMGDADAYQYAEINAQWGNTAKALEWLDAAMRLRDSGLQYLKTDPLIDPLRKEPRFQAVERALKFPS